MKGFFVLCAGQIVDEKIDSGTEVGKKLSKAHEKIKGISKHSPSSQSWFEQRNNSKGHDGNGEHKELDGQSDEHFGNADLFAGQTGGSLAAPSNNLGESDRRDDGSYQHDNWTTYCQKETVKRAVQSIDHGFIPEVVIVDVILPGNPLRAHLIETRDLIHGSDGKSCKH